MYKYCFHSTHYFLWEKIVHYQIENMQSEYKKKHAIEFHRAKFKLLKLSKNAYKTSFNGIQYNISFCLLIACFQFEIEQFFPIKNNVFK